MKDAIAALFEQALDQLIEQGIIQVADRKAVKIENTRDPAHGDLATNVAMLHAKGAQMDARAIAEVFINKLPPSEMIRHAEIAGPGFINMYLAKNIAFEPVISCLKHDKKYGDHKDTNERIQIEYVSANPTGPLHVGHGRGAAYGATLVNLLSARGHDVEAEYYVNDAGRQMDILAVSVFLRYLENTGQCICFPTAGYRGSYISDLGNNLLQNSSISSQITFNELQKNVVTDSEETKDAHIDGLIRNAKQCLGEEWLQPFNLALSAILSDIKNDLSEFGANFDQWFSEKSLVTSGEVDTVIATLEDRGHLYEKAGALWFKSKNFGDDKDRVIRKDNGETTYFTSDIAYIANKLTRGFDRIIYIWGADHHGYIVRIKAAAQALGFNPERLTIRLVQFANLYKGGKRLQMSTRSGSFVTLRELRDDIGRDACRYFYVMRKADQHLDFDLSLATSQSKDNPVYYVQYAHARICRVFESIDETPFNQIRGVHHLADLTTQEELDLATTIGLFPEVIKKAADGLEPHLVCYYLQDLAANFHKWYNGNRLLVETLEVRDARLALAKAVQIVIRNGLALLGVSAPRSM